MLFDRFHRCFISFIRLVMETPGSSCGNAFAFVKDGGPLGTPTPPAEGGGDGWFSQLSLDPNVANPRNAAIVPSVTTSSRAWNSYPTMPFLPLKSCIHHYVWSFTTTWHCKLQNSSFKKNLQKSSLLTFPALCFQQKINPTLVFLQRPKFPWWIQVDPMWARYVYLHLSRFQWRVGPNTHHGSGILWSLLLSPKKNIQQPGWGRDISEGLFDGTMCEMCEFLWHVHMDVSENRGTPKSSMLIFNRVFRYKPSILGYPYFWKHPY